MSWRRQLSKFGVLLRRSKPADDLEEEIRLHLEMEERENLESGMPPDEAHYAALRRFGNVILARERSKEMWGRNWAETFWQDLRYGWRMLLKNPGFTTVAVLTLALGIGANTAIFSLVDAVLLKTLPVQKPEQLYRLTSISNEGRTNDAFSYPTFKLLEATNQTLSGVIAFRPMGNVDFVVNGTAELARGQAVSGGYFTTLGVNPILGRTIKAGDDARGASPVAVISYAYWTARFNRSPSAAGAAITLNGAAFTVIGVTPPEFFGLEPGESVDVSVPLASLPVAQPQFAAAGTPYDVLAAPFRNWLHLMARLKDGETEARALANLGPVYEQAMRQAAEGMGGCPSTLPERERDSPKPGSNWNPAAGA